MKKKFKSRKKMTSMLFRSALNVARKPTTVAIRRSIVTTPVRQNADPLIGHIHQEARAGSVNI